MIIYYSIYYAKISKLQKPNVNSVASKNVRRVTQETQLVILNNEIIGKDI